MTGPATSPTASPLGPWAPLVASIISVALVGAAVADHLAVALGRVASGDPFLDSAALVVVGIVLGIGGIGGQSSAALSIAQAAHSRLDELGVPPATTPGQHIE